MQSLMPIKNLLTHKEALIHLWGDAPEGNLARPFTAENPLGGLANMFGVGGSDAAPAATSSAANNTEDNHAHRD